MDTDRLPSPKPLLRDIEAAWRARSDEMQVYTGSRPATAAAASPSPTEDVRIAPWHANHFQGSPRATELLQQLKLLSAARSRARDMAQHGRRSPELVPAAPVPAEEIAQAERGIDEAMNGVKRHFIKHSPRTLAKEAAAAEAAKRAAAKAAQVPMAWPHAKVVIRSDPVRLGAKQFKQSQFQHTRKCLSPDKPEEQDPFKHLGPPRQHSFGSLTKRKSSRDQPQGTRKYKSWVQRGSMLRQGLAKTYYVSKGTFGEGLGHVRDQEEMEGKITSLTMISQSLRQQKYVVAALKKRRAFLGASDIHLSMISTLAKTRYHDRYSVIYRESASSHTFYILVKGTLEFTSQDGDPIVLKEPMTCFGTEGLTGGMPRVKTATCLTDCELLHFSTFRMRLSEQGVDEYARRAFATFVEEELKKMPLFFGLKSTVLFQIATMFELREVQAANTVLYQPDDGAEEMYVLAKGRVVLTSADGIELVKLQAGSVEDGYPFFGESALLDRGLRTTYATTRTPCKLLVLKRPFFPRIVKLMPNLLEKLREFYELRQSRAQLARLAAADLKKRRAIERRARLRDQAMGGDDQKGAAEALREMVLTKVDEDTEKTAEEVEAEQEDDAALKVQKVWRGKSTRRMTYGPGNVPPGLSEIQEAAREGTLAGNGAAAGGGLPPRAASCSS